MSDKKPEIGLPVIARNEEITIEEFNMYKTDEEITGYYIKSDQAHRILDLAEEIYQYGNRMTGHRAVEIIGILTNHDEE